MTGSSSNGLRRGSLAGGYTVAIIASAIAAAVPYVLHPILGEGHGDWSVDWATPP